MSRPWQFADDSARSPFDRQAPQQPAQPPSFKTNVNRNKSRKWAEAKNYSYDGDDWGGYDPYDEYDGYDNEGDSHTDPAPLMPSSASMKQRRNSFDRGDEQRSFSAGFQQPQTPQNNHMHTSNASSSSDPRVPHDASRSTPRGPYDIRRDFTQPAHVPPPLSFRASPSPAQPPVPSSAERFPPRKSSLSGGSPMPGSVPTSPTPKSASAEKPLPFIRPSDIYKRMQEEQEKERSSLDSSRPSIDSSPARPSASDNAGLQPSRDRRPSNGSASNFTARRPSLEPVTESRESYLATQSHLEPLQERQRETEIQGMPSVAPVSSTLPQVSRVASAFGSEFWGASGLSDELRLADESRLPASLSPDAGSELTSSQSQSADKTLEHQPSLGFRSVVHQAFDRKDDSSVPPTPISRDNSQSHYGSETSGISPIMSRVPSAATAESRFRIAEMRDNSVPPIVEETSQPTSPELGGPASENHTFARKPSPSHSRTTSAEGVPASFTPGYRRSLEPPSQEGSPARTPELEYTKRLSQPLTADEFPSADSRQGDPIKPPPTDYSKRESDLAEESSSPERSTFGIATAAQSARAQFLNTHSPTLGNSPTFSKPASPMSRSPSPGGASRVRELAGRYDEIHAVSRSNSSLSIRSKSSVQSWERSDDNLPLKRAATFESNKSDKDELNLPQYDNADSQDVPLQRDDNSRSSFRPQLPGGWVSYVSAADTAKSEDAPADNEVTPRKADFDHDAGQSGLASPGTPRPASRATEPVDFTPSTIKQNLPERRVSGHEGGPVSAVKAAGDALGTALMASVGLGGGHQTRDFASQQPTAHEEAQTQRPAVGDIFLKPLSRDETASSIASSIAPTPPAKDTPKHEPVERSSGYFPKPVVRTDTDGMTSLNSPEEMESDRLRKEIERSLNADPLPTPDHVLQRERDQDALDGPANLRDLQQAENLPPSSTPHYESAPALSVSGVSVAQTHIAPGSTAEERPALLDNRFSWEERPPASEPLFATEDTEPRAPYERPLSSQGLHIVNTSISLESLAASPTPQDTLEELPERGIISPVPEETARLRARSTSSDTGAGVHRDLDSLSPEPIVDESHERTTQEVTSIEPQADVSKMIPEASTTVSATPASSDSTRIPPFREILALKSPPQRISKYNETRNQFATMDTGLTNWLQTTIESKPEHAHLTTSGANLGLTTSNTTGSVRQKHGPNLMNMARKLGPSRDNTSSSAPSQVDPVTSGGPERQASVSQTGTEKMQARGKDLMKSAGAFGGKASFGAKGLFAKAKGKLREGGGGEKTSQSALSKGGRSSEPLGRSFGRPITPISNDVVVPPAEPRPVDTGKTETATQQRTTDRPDQASASTSRDVHRVPSRPNSRLSAAFSHFRDGSSMRSKSRHSSTALSAVEINTEDYRTDTKSPALLSPAETVIAPWASPDELDVTTPQQRIGPDGRVGLLPSPALDVQMSLDQPMTEHNAETRVSEDPQKQTDLRPWEDVSQGKGNDPKPHALDSISKTIAAVETSEALPSAEHHRLSRTLFSSTPNEVEQEPLAAELPQEGPTHSIVSPIGSVIRSPQARPSRFSDAYTPATLIAAPERSMSPVSSLGEAEEHQNKLRENEGKHLERTVSPVDESAMDAAQVQPMSSMLIAANGDELKAIKSDEPQQEEKDNDPPQERPETERRTSRSSLPSQQRPPLDSRRTSYGAWGSRRASQVLEPATEGVVTPHFGSRRNSVERFYGYGDSPAGQRIVPFHEPQGYFTAEELSAATAYNLSNSPVIHDASTDTAEVDSSRSSVALSQAGATLTEAQRHYGHGQRPVSANAPPPVGYLSQQYAYTQKPVSSYIPQIARGEEQYQRNQVDPTVFDSRQPATQPQRGTELDDSTTYGYVNKSINEAQALDTLEHRIVLEPLETSKGVETSAVSDKKERRRSSIFRAFSRSNSISDGWQSRLPSRGSTTAGVAVDPVGGTVQQQQTHGHANPAVLAAQRAGEGSTPKGNTLKKLQRSSTSAVASEPVKKEKRFSRLGSIFGRRNSQITESKKTDTRKSNRLVKPMPPSQSPAKGTTPRQGSREELSGYNGPQQYKPQNLPIPPSQVQALYQNQRGQQGAADLPQLPAAWTAPPPGGWYAPSGRPSSFTEDERQQQKFREPTLPLVQPTGISPVQTTRRLHSEGFRREPRYMTSSPGPASIANASAAPQERFYTASGNQSIPPGARMPDHVDRGWEQTVPPQQTSRTLPIPLPTSHPQQDQRYASGSGPSQRPLSWRQHSYGSENGQHFDGFSSYGTSPNNAALTVGTRRQNSFSSDNRLTPTHSRSASFGAAPKEAYRMSNPYEGEEMLQRNLDNSLYLHAQQGHDAAYYADRGAYPLQPPNGAGNASYEPDSASSSPYKRRDTGATAAWGYGSSPPPTMPVQRSTTPGSFYQSSTARPLSGSWQYANVTAPSPAQSIPGMAIAMPPPVSSASQIRAMNAGQPKTPSGSRHNSLVMINEDFPFPGQQSQIQSQSPGPGMGDVQQPQQQQGYRGGAYGSPVRTGSYFANAERRRMERRESAGAAAGAGVGYFIPASSFEQRLPQTGGAGAAAGGYAQHLRSASANGDGHANATG